MGGRAVVDTLRELGPSLASKVARALQSKGLTPEAARKQIERAEGIKRLPLVFPRKERFLYLPEQAGWTSFHDAVVDALRATKSVHGAAYDAIQSYGGSLPEQYFHSRSGAPIQLGRHKTSGAVLRELLALQLLNQEIMPGLGRCLTLRRPVGDRPEKTWEAKRARLTAEALLIGALRDWLRKLNFAGYHSISERPPLHPEAAKAPIFAQFEWDLVGPSYILPIATLSRSGPVPGFVVADVAFDDLSEADLRYFFRKVSSVRSIRSMRPFLAFFVARSYDREVFQMGKDYGLVLTTVSTLLGSDIAAAMNELVATLTNAGAAIARNPEVASILFDKLGGMEGAALNLRGPLFELIVGHCARAVDHAENVNIGVPAYDGQGNQAEIDVLALHGTTNVSCYECKGIVGNTAISLAQVRKWIESKVPVANRWLRMKEPYRLRAQRFVLCTTGSFSKDALEYLEQRKAQTTQYVIEWKAGPQVLADARKANTRLAKTLEEHFLRSPLVRALGTERSRKANEKGTTAGV